MRRAYAEAYRKIQHGDTREQAPRGIPVIVASGALLAYLLFVSSIGAPLWLRILADTLGAIVFLRYRLVTGWRERTKAAPGEAEERRKRKSEPPTQDKG